MTVKTEIESEKERWRRRKREIDKDREKGLQGKTCIEEKERRRNGEREDTKKIVSERKWERECAK